MRYVQLNCRFYCVKNAVRSQEKIVLVNLFLRNCIEQWLKTYIHLRSLVCGFELIPLHSDFKNNDLFSFRFVCQEKTKILKWFNLEIVSLDLVNTRKDCCGILLTPLRCFKQIKRTVSFDVTTRFNAIQQSTAMYNSHIFNVRNTTIKVTKRSTINVTKRSTIN